MQKIDFTLTVYGQAKINLIKDFRSALRYDDGSCWSLASSKLIIETALDNGGKVKLRMSDSQFGVFATMTTFAFGCKDLEISNVLLAPNLPELIDVSEIKYRS